MGHMRFITFTMLGILSSAGLFYYFLDQQKPVMVETTYLKVVQNTNNGKSEERLIPMGNFAEEMPSRQESWSATLSVSVDENARVVIDGVNMVRKCGSDVYQFSLIKHKKESHEVTCFGKRESYALVHKQEEQKAS